MLLGSSSYDARLLLPVVWCVRTTPLWLAALVVPRTAAALVVGAAAAGGWWCSYYGA